MACVLLVTDATDGTHVVEEHCKNAVQTCCLGERQLANLL